MHMKTTARVTINVADPPSIGLSTRFVLVFTR
jgi:hypothetical protein